MPFYNDIQKIQHFFLKAINSDRIYDLLQFKFTKDSWLSFKKTNVVTDGAYVNKQISNDKISNKKIDKHVRFFVLNRSFNSY